jgi:hypothetical protein
MDGAQVLNLSAAHCIPFQPPLACVNKQKALVANVVSLTGGK